MESAEKWVNAIDYLSYEFSKSYVMTKIQILTPTDTQDSDA